MSTENLVKLIKEVESSGAENVKEVIWNMSEYDEATHNEFIESKKDIDYGDVQSLGSDAFFTDETLDPIREAYIEGDLLKIGSMVSLYMDHCLLERAAKHVEALDAKSEELMNITRVL